MEILYRRRRATVEDIRSELLTRPARPAFKLLDIMIERGLLARKHTSRVPGGEAEEPAARP